MMRRRLGLVLLGLLAGCGQAGHDGGRQGGTAEADQSAGPRVGPTAAPGVAFNYRYSFRLPAERIIDVQEEHVQACEKLGVARCRVTGLKFRRTGDNDIEAQLDLKLDPAIARAFGKQGVAAVVHADGLLAEEEISGEDAGGAIEAANRGEGQQAEQLRRIEAQLARPGLGAAERAQLQAEAQQIREAISASQAVKAEKQDSLARTPMTFAYESGDMAPGLRRSLRNGIANLVDGTEALLTLAITLLPWILAGLLIWWGIRRFRRKAVPQAA